MTMAAPHCTCAGPLADLFPDRPCPVHGSRFNRERLAAAERLAAENERLRVTLTAIAEHPSITSRTAESMRQWAKRTLDDLPPWETEREQPECSSGYCFWDPVTGDPHTCPDLAPASGDSQEPTR